MNHSTVLGKIDQLGLHYWTKKGILSSIENKQFELDAFVDFSKAFDSLNRNLLLQKLDLYAVRGVIFEIFYSYLSEIKEYVCIDSFTSTVRSNFLSVPQGSI